MNPWDFTEEELEAGREPVNVPELVVGVLAFAVLVGLLVLLAGGWPG